MMSDKARLVASQVWRHRDSVTGQELVWAQEDEEAVTTKAEAVAMLQRTIDFWVVKLRDDIMAQQGLGQSISEQRAVDTFKRTFTKMMLDNPFPRRFGITLADLRIEF